MLFPQIRTQGVLQETASRRVWLSRSQNRLADGTRIQGELIRPMVRSWRLSYAGLTDGEAGALRQMIEESRTAPNGFVFIDPWSNMLGHSEDLASEEWQPSALCQVTRANPNELGIAEHSVQSLSSVAERVEQIVPLGGTGTFSLGCEVRSATQSSGRLTLQGGGLSFTKNFVVGAAWTQVWVLGEFDVMCEDLRVSIEVAPGEAALVRAVELDYQAAPSSYKPSYGAGGVYMGARVVEEEFVQVLRGQGWFDCQLEVRVD